MEENADISSSNESVKAGDAAGAKAAAELPDNASPEDQMKALGKALAAAALSGATAALTAGSVAATAAASVASSLGITIGSAAASGSVLGPIGAALAVFAAFCAFVIARLAKSIEPVGTWFDANVDAPGRPGFVAEQEKIKGLFRVRPDLLPLCYSRYLWAYHKVALGVVPRGVTRFRGEEITDDNLQSYYERTSHKYGPGWFHLGGRRPGKRESWRDHGPGYYLYSYDEYVSELAFFSGDEAIIRQWSDLLMGLPLTRKAREIYRYRMWQEKGWLLGTPEQRARLRGAQFSGARRAILSGYNAQTIKGTSRAALAQAARARTIAGGAKGVRLALSQASLRPALSTSPIATAAAAGSAHTGLGAVLGGLAGAVGGGLLGSLPGAALGGATGAAIGAAIGSRR